MSNFIRRCRIFHTTLADILALRQSRIQTANSLGNTRFGQTVRRCGHISLHRQMAEALRQGGTRQHVGMRRIGHSIFCRRSGGPRQFDRLRRLESSTALSFLLKLRTNVFVVLFIEL